MVRSRVRVEYFGRGRIVSTVGVFCSRCSGKLVFGCLVRMVSLQFFGRRIQLALIAISTQFMVKTILLPDGFQLSVLADSYFVHPQQNIINRYLFYSLITYNIQPKTKLSNVNQYTFNSLSKHTIFHICHTGETSQVIFITIILYFLRFVAIIVGRMIQIIKELNLAMSDIFIVRPKKPYLARPTAEGQSGRLQYTSLQGEFLNRSYGYYTSRFVEKIAELAFEKQQCTAVLSIHKIMMETIKKYLLSDLEVVVVGHICSLLDWNIHQPFLKHHSKILRCEQEDLPILSRQLVFLLNLSAYFVKNYMGQIQESIAITSYLQAQSGGEWEPLFQQWLKTCPSDIFKLSPRAINKLYSQFTRDCQKVDQIKNYNKMVDNILELSTTYSMIPGATKISKKRSPQSQPIESRSAGRKLNSKSFIADGFISRLHESKISNSLLESIQEEPKQAIGSGKQEKRIRLKSKDKSQPVSSHVADFFEKSNVGFAIQEFRGAKSSIGVVDSFQGFLDGSRISDRYDQLPLPYLLRSNSDASKLWQ